MSKPPMGSKKVDRFLASSAETPNPTRAPARIGDGRSTLEDGLVSRVNATAADLGMRPGMPARDAVELVLPASI